MDQALCSAASCDSHSSSADSNDLPKPKLLDQVRNAIRLKHYSIRTEQCYIDWVRRYIYFHNKKHPSEMDERHISAFLTDLAVNKKVASSTQNQALCALVFLYREVIKKDPGQFRDVAFAKRPAKLPVVFTLDEVKAILIQLEGTAWIMGQLLYGSGLRLMECIRLRVKDVDFGYKQVVVRDGKGNKDRVTMRGNFKTSPRAQYPRWGEASNPRNTTCMSAVGRLTPP